MVSPIYLIAVALLVAFLLGVIDRLSRGLSITATMLTLLWMVGLSATWLFATLSGAASAEVLTAGFEPPLSINLRMGALEAGATLIANAAFLGSAVILRRRFRSEGIGAQILLLLMAMGANGLVLTRDLFNLFVFLEISAIATYGFIALENNGRALQAGFKYIIAGGISSAVLLLGTIYLYRLTGTLNIDGIAAAVSSTPALVAAGAGLSAAFLVTAAILVELKTFPANGWALDVYEAAHPATAAVISAGTATAMAVALDKLLPLMPESIVRTVAAVGFIGFAASNLLGLRQTGLRRMLGYSSVAQVSLVAGVLAVGAAWQWPRDTVLCAAGALLVNHAFAKAGLFWSSLALGADRIAEARGRLRGRYAHTLFIGALIVALSGLPPFAGFFGKWELVLGLAGNGSFGWIAVVLAGSLFEAVYLFRFFGAALGERRTEEPTVVEHPGTVDSGTAVGPTLGVFALLALAAGLVSGWASGFTDLLGYTAVVAAGIGLLLDWLPARIKAVLVTAGAVGYTAFLLPVMSGLGQIFLLVVPVGSALVAFAGLYRSGRAAGFFPLLAALAASMSSLLIAHDALSFLVGFELMTVSSYLLLLRRPRAEQPATRYLGFSLGGAFLLMAGLAVLRSAGGRFLVPTVPSSGFEGTAAISQLLRLGSDALPLAGLVLIALGFLVKTGAVGLHIWLPSTYGEAEGETSAVFSAVISKIPILGLLVTVAGFAAAAGVAEPAAAANDARLAAGALTVMAWVGMLTAVSGALLAVFQEDVKYLLAYSSMSQIGYIVAALALATHLGWTAGLYLTVLHFAVKGMLFLAIAGVILRTGARQFHELGGLIRQMPLTFVSVLIAIIALSGVPPLAGFGGKWLIYTAFLESGEYLLAAIAFFASTIAFLYLFKLIHAVFLGQPKDHLRGTREAPPALLVPQLLLLVGVMAASMYPQIILEPIAAAVTPIFGQTLVFEDYTVTSTLGYWNGSWVMYVTTGIFALPLLVLAVIMRKPRRVGQFDIVYAAERPERPETTHYAHNFFAHYYRALGFLTAPGVIGFWRGVQELVAAMGGGLRRLYTGNGQTYAVHILLFVALLYLILGGI